MGVQYEALIQRITNTSGKEITSIVAGNKVRIYFMSTATSGSFSYRARVEYNLLNDDGEVKSSKVFGEGLYVETAPIPAKWLGTSISDTMKIKLVTYNPKGECVGTDYKEITVYNPNGGISTNPPTPINGPTIEYVSAGNAAVDSWNQSSSEPIFVKGFSKGKFTFTGGLSGYTRTTNSIPNCDDATMTSSSAVFTTSTFTVAGTQNSSVTFYFGSASYPKNFSFYIYDYSPPSVSYVDVTRCDYSGNYDPAGTYMKCSYAINLSSIGGYNGIDSSKSYIQYREKGTGSWYNSTNISSLNGVVRLPTYFDATKVYEIKVVAYDAIGQSSENYSSATTAERMLNFAPYGNGLAIGQVSTVKTREESGKFEVGWDTEFGTNVTFNGRTDFNESTFFNKGLTASSLYATNGCTANSLSETGRGANLIKSKDISNSTDITVIVGDYTYANSVVFYGKTDGYIKFGTTDHQIAGLMLNGEKIDLSGGGATTTSELEPTYTYANQQGMGGGAPLIKFKGQQGQNEKLKTAATVQYVQNYVNNSVTGSHTHSTSQITPTYNSTNNYLINFNGVTNNDYKALTPAWIKKELETQLFNATLEDASGGTKSCLIKFSNTSSDYYGATVTYVQKYVTGKKFATESWVTSQNYATESWVTGKKFATKSWVTSQNYATGTIPTKTTNLKAEWATAGNVADGVISFSNANNGNKAAATPGYVKGNFKPLTSSDKRLKTNISDSFVDSLNMINQIRMRSFTWTQESHRGEYWDVGVIADELELLDSRFLWKPDLLDDPIPKYKNIDTWYLTGHILKAIQQLSEKIDQLESKINNM